MYWTIFLMIGNLVAHPSQSTRPPIVLGKSVQASFQSRESAKGLQMFQTLELEHITSCRHAFIYSALPSLHWCSPHFLSISPWLVKKFFFVSHDMVRLIREGKEIYSFNNIRSPLLCLTFKSYEKILPFILYLSSSLPPGNSSPGLQKSVKVWTISPCTWILKILRAFALLFKL